MHRNQKLDRLYAKIPKIKCKRLCQQGCGPIDMSAAEYKRIEERLGFRPAFKNEAGSCNSCSMLNDKGACSVYDIRPMICRLWGVVKRLQCPFGCLPDHWLSDKEAFGLLEETKNIMRDKK